jgi:hypothetical protein
MANGHFAGPVSGPLVRCLPTVGTHYTYIYLPLGLKAKRQSMPRREVGLLHNPDQKRIIVFPTSVTDIVRDDITCVSKLCPVTST